MNGISVTLPRLGSPVDELWHVLLDLDEAVGAPWTLIGGQMVLLHALEHQQTPPQVSQDGDVVVNIRAAPNGLKKMIEVLENWSFSLEGISAENVGHRYVRSPANASGSGKMITIDILAPEGTGERTDLTTGPSAHTVRVPGGTQALQRTERITVIHENRTGHVPRPSLLAAIVAKAAAVGLPDHAERHLADLALLCALVEDPIALREQFLPKDRERLRCARSLRDDAHVAWLAVPNAIRKQGQQGYVLMTEEL